MGLTYWLNITFDVENQQSLKTKVEEYFDNKLKRNKYVMNSFSFVGETKWVNVEEFVTWFFDQKEVNNHNSIYTINEDYDVEVFHLRNWRLRLTEYLSSKGMNESTESLQAAGERYIKDRAFTTISMDAFNELKKTMTDEEILNEITQSLANRMGEDYFRNPEWELSNLPNGKQHEFYNNLGHA